MVGQFAIKASFIFSKLPKVFWCPPLRNFLQVPQVSILIMAFAYPEFNGMYDKDVIGFLEHMEVSCISSHMEDRVLILRLLQICLKGDAHNWYKEPKLQLSNHRLFWEWMR